MEDRIGKVVSMDGLAGSELIQPENVVDEGLLGIRWPTRCMSPCWIGLSLCFTSVLQDMC